MHLNEHSNNFRIRLTNRKLSNASSLVRSQSLKDRKLSATHFFQNQIKTMDYLKVPITNSPVFQNRKKQSKRIVPKKLTYNPDLIMKDLADKDTRISLYQPLLSPKSFNQVTLKQLIKRQDEEQTKGECSYSFGYWPSQGKIVFIKQINSQANSRIEQNVSSLNHRGITEYFGVEKINNSTFFFSQFLACGNLEEFMQHQKKPLEQILIKNIVRQLVKTVKYIHSKGSYHGDIRPSKILMDQRGCFKLTLVSSMTPQSITPKSNIRKLLWSSPEKILNQKITQAGDIWSIGMIVLEAITKKKPWCFRAYKLFKTTQNLMEMIQTHKVPNLPLDKQSDLISFLQGCLKFNPEERSTIEELSESKFLAQF